MGVFLSDIQTKCRNKLFLISRFLSLYFNRLNILNIIRSIQKRYGGIGDIGPFRKWKYFSPISKPSVETNNFQFFDFWLYFFFLTDWILSDQADKNMNIYWILRHFRKWEYFSPISKPSGEKQNFRIFDFLLYFFLTDY